jgi:hypothetical protein
MPPVWKHPSWHGHHCSACARATGGQGLVQTGYPLANRHRDPGPTEMSLPRDKLGSLVTVGR